jgi:phage terminase large subunit GpA-like protein
MKKKLTQEYLSYIQSSDWFKKAQRIRDRDVVCQGCGSEKNLDVHHKTYKRFKHESDEDLILICRQCHEQIHKKKKKSNLDKVTNKLIKMTQNRAMRFDKLDEKCRKCGGILIMRQAKLTEKRLKRAYHFCHFKQCLSCSAFFMLEEFKTYPNESCNCERV